MTVCISFIVLLAVLAVNDSDLLANFVLHFGQQQRVSVAHDGTLLQACEEKIPPETLVQIQCRKSFNDRVSSATLC